MEDRIFEIIKSWAAIPTWHTSHPLDQKRFSIAMHNLVDELGSNIDIEDFEKALLRHASNNAATLGEPAQWDKLVNKFALKAETILTYESER